MMGDLRRGCFDTPLLGRNLVVMANGSVIRFAGYSRAFTILVVYVPVPVCTSSR